MSFKHYVLMPDSKAAMDLQNLLREAKLDTTLAPTPREADHCCGVCILYADPKDRDTIERIATKESIPIDEFWKTEDKDDPYRGKFL